MPRYGLERLSLASGCVVIGGNADIGECADASFGGDNGDLILEELARSATVMRLVEGVSGVGVSEGGVGEGKGVGMGARMRGGGGEGRQAGNSSGDYQRETQEKSCLLYDMALTPKKIGFLVSAGGDPGEAQTAILIG